MKLRYFTALALVGLIFAPFCIAMGANELRARELATLLDETALPGHAQIIDSSYRVFNGGNGNGCDYQGLAIVSYWGDMSKLRAAFMAPLSRFAEQFDDAKILAGELSSVDSWTGKIFARSTELTIRPNTDHMGLYLVDLTVSARMDSLDPRCT